MQKFKRLVMIFFGLCTASCDNAGENKITYEARGEGYSTVLASGDDAVEEVLREHFDLKKGNSNEDFSQEEAMINALGGHLAHLKFMATATPVELSDMYSSYGLSINFGVKEKETTRERDRD